MRITVGGVLIVLGAAAAGYFAADTSHLTWVRDKTTELTKQAASLVGLYKAGESPKPNKEVYAPPPPFASSVPIQPAGATATVAGSTDTSAKKMAAALLSTATVNNVQPAVANVPSNVVAPAPTPAPVVHKKSIPKKHHKKVARRLKKQKVAKKVVPAPLDASSDNSAVANVKARNAHKLKTPSKTNAKAAAEEASTGPNIEKMIGTYVSLELITGRSVQGVLQGKSDTNYTLDVPGLGPLDYPVENVRSITPAQ